jgi:hypothetical protein
MPADSTESLWQQIIHTVTKAADNTVTVKTDGTLTMATL